MNKRRGQVEGMEEARSGARVVKAQVPLSEMFGYVDALMKLELPSGVEVEIKV